MSLLIRWFLNAVVIMLVAYIVPGLHVSGVFAALIIAIVLGIINITLRPLLLILTLPINIITLGLFTFVINGLMLWLASYIVKGFSIDSFMSALVGSIFISLIHYFIERVAHSSND